MAQATGPEPKGRRKRHRVRNAALLFVFMAAVFVLALPRIMSTGFGRAWLVGRVNAEIAPGSIGLEGLRLAWWAPIELDGLSLIDPKKKRVVNARSVRLDRGLIGLLAGRPDYGTITIEGADVDVERRVDGTIDALDALGGLLKPAAPGPAPGAGVQVPGAGGPAPSATKVVVVVKGSKLRAVSPELAEPLVAGMLDATLTLAPDKPMILAATLSNGSSSVEAKARLHEQGPGRGAGDLAISVVGKDWPLRLKGPGAVGRCRFAGTLDATRLGGLWAAKGNAALVEFEADGPSLAGDHLAFDRVTLDCDLGQTPGGWAIRRFAAICPVARLDAGGSYPLVDGTPTRLVGVVDLAALAKLIPNALRLRDGLTIDRGRATVRLDLAARGGVEQVELLATFLDFAATEGGRKVALQGLPTLAASATRTGSKVTVGRFEVKGSGVDVWARGDLDAGVKLQGTVDLSALHDQLAQVLDFGGVGFAGHARLAADYRKLGDRFKARLIADCKPLDLSGLAAEPIHRDLVRLDGSAVGPHALDGLPTGWNSAKLDLKAGDLVADVEATSGGANPATLALAANLGLDVGSPAPGRFGAKGSLAWDGKVLTIADLRAALVPSDPASAPGAVALAVQGRYDLKGGELALGPIAGISPGALGLGADGLRVTGLGQGPGPLVARGHLVGDLAAADRLMAAWSGSPSKGLGGAYAARLNATRSKLGQLDINGQVDIDDLFTPSSAGPVSLAARLGYRPDEDRVDLAALGLTTGYGRVDLDGMLREPNGRRLLDIQGTFAPRWDVIDGIVARSAGPDASIRATVRPFRLGGMLRADTTAAMLGQMSGEFGLDVASAQAYGVKIGKAAVVLKAGAGHAQFDPIVTTVNTGLALIRGRLALDDDLGLWLKLDGSRVDDAAIDDAVSTALLSFVAPVLNEATGVTGKVSFVISDKGAEIPLTAKSGSARLDGVMAFNDVVCKPGPFAAEVLALTGRPDLKLAIAQPLALSVADGRVRQSGLSIPLGNAGARLGFEGSVGFDQTVDARATVPITASMLGRDPTLNKLVAGTNITIPIGGTLAKPDIDRRALHAALRDATKSLVDKGLKDEAGRFLERVAGPNPGGGGGAGPKANPTRDAVRGLLEGLGKEVGADKP